MVKSFKRFISEGRRNIESDFSDACRQAAEAHLSDAISRHKKENSKDSAEDLHYAENEHEILHKAADLADEGLHKEATDMHMEVNGRAHERVFDYHQKSVNAYHDKYAES